MNQFRQDEVIRARIVRLLLQFEVIFADEALSLMNAVGKPRSSIWFSVMVELNTKLGFYNDLVALLENVKSSVEFDVPLAIEVIKAAQQVCDLKLLESCLAHIRRCRISSFALTEVIAKAYVAMGQNRNGLRLLG